MMRTLNILLILIPVFWCHPGESDSGSLKNTIVWDQMVYDFGDVINGKSADVKFEATNKGSELLVIKRVQGSCGCTATDYTKIPIPPGDKGSVLATFSAKTIGPFNKTISVHTNFQPDPYVLRIKGRVVSDIQ